MILHFIVGRVYQAPLQGWSASRLPQMGLDYHGYISQRHRERSLLLFNIPNRWE